MSATTHCHEQGDPASGYGRARAEKYELSKKAARTAARVQQGW